MPVTLNENGYFQRDGERIIPVGVNYWPGSCGVEVWQQWPSDEIQHDLDVLVEHGLNAMRMFLLWPDFQTARDRVERRQLERLRQWLGWAGDRGILIQPTLFVGFMSGGFFWPRFKGEQNLYEPGSMREACIHYARQCAAVIREAHDHLLGIDLGNELVACPDSAAAPPAHVRDWCADMCTAIRSVYPEALIINGLDQNQVVNDRGWRFGAQPGCDLYSMHGYPVPTWHSTPFDGMTDPLCQSLLPFYSQCARAFGPVSLQEFGTILGKGSTQPDAYLRGMLPAAWEAGANSFLWWCMRDIHLTRAPYNKGGKESSLGLFEDDDTVRPTLRYFVDFAREVHTRPDAAPASGPEAVGIYWPRHYYPQGDPESPGNRPQMLSRRMVIANYMLRQCGRTTRTVRGDPECALPTVDEVPVLFSAGAAMTRQEAADLLAWVEAGGTLVLHGLSMMQFGPEIEQLTGALPVDFRGGVTTRLTAFGQDWTFEDTSGSGFRLQVEPRTAKVEASDADGLPIILRNTVGRGRVVAVLPMVDEALAHVAGDRAARDAGIAWYRGLLNLIDDKED